MGALISWWLWGSAAALYAIFRLWYDNRGGKLTAAEIEHYIERARAAGSDAVNGIGSVRQFLEADDGREFFMVNLVRFAPGEIAHPDTGLPTTGQALMQQYSQAFMPNMLRYAGHPGLATRKTGPYVDAWQVPPDPGWNIVGVMRYRSRRDMIDMATDPKFSAIHKYKITGVAETFSFPTRPIVMLMAGPRIWLALLLLLVAAFIQIGVLIK